MAGWVDCCCLVALARCTDDCPLANVVRDSLLPLARERTVDKDRERESERASERRKHHHEQANGRASGDDRENARAGERRAVIKTGERAGE